MSLIFKGNSRVKSRRVTRIYRTMPLLKPVETGKAGKRGSARFDYYPLPGLGNLQSIGRLNFRAHFIDMGIEESI